METAQWYFISISILIVASLANAVLRPLLAWARKHGEPFFLWKLYYPYLPRPDLHSGTTRFEAALIALFLAINTFCLTWKVSDSARLARRAAHLAAANCGLLMLGGRINTIFDQCQISLDNFSRAHRWFGRVAFLQVCVHVFAAGSRHGLRISSAHEAAGLAVGFAVSMILDLSYDA